MIFSSILHPAGIRKLISEKIYLGQENQNAHFSQNFSVY